MQDYDRTVLLTDSPLATSGMSGLAVTIFDGDKPPRTIQLSQFNKEYITFGRNPQNDIVLTSKLVSHDHGRFCFRGGQWIM